MATLKGLLPDRAVTILQNALAQVSSLQERFVAFSKQPFVQRPQADALYGPPNQQKQLQVNGSNPLNVTGLLGVLSQAQYAKVNNQPGVPPNGQTGSIITINNVISQIIGPNTATPLFAVSAAGVNVQTGDYTAVAADSGKLIVFNSTTTPTLTLPNPPPSANWSVFVQSIGQTATTAGVIVNRNGLTIDGLANNVISPCFEGFYIATDGTNYFTTRAVSLGLVKTETASFGLDTLTSGVLYSCNSASPMTATLPATIPFLTWTTFIQNTGAGNLTVDPHGLNLDGSASSLALTTGQGVYIATDGADYFTMSGIGGSSVSTALGQSTTFWTSWQKPTITHNLNTENFLIRAYDQSGVEAFATSMLPTNPDTAIIDFGTTFTGTIVLIGGTGPSAQSPSKYGTSWVAQTLVPVVHNLGTTAVAFKVYDASGNWQIPDTEQVTDQNTVTLGFSTAFTGSVVVIGGAGGSLGSFVDTVVAQTAVTVTHGLGTTDVDFECIDSTLGVVFPATAQVTGANTIAFTFSPAFTGTITVIG